MGGYGIAIAWRIALQIDYFHLLLSLIFDV